MLEFAQSPRDAFKSLTAPLHVQDVGHPPDCIASLGTARPHRGLHYVSPGEHFIRALACRAWLE